MCLYMLSYVYICMSMYILFQQSINNIKSEKMSKLSKKKDLFCYYAHNPYKEWTVTITFSFFFFSFVFSCIWNNNRL